MPVECPPEPALGFGSLLIVDADARDLLPLSRPPLTRLSEIEQERRRLAIRGVSDRALLAVLAAALAHESGPGLMLQVLEAAGLVEPEPEPEPQPEPEGGVECLICSRRFLPRRGAVFCSPDCRGIHRTLRPERPPVESGGHENVCEICGNIFRSKRQRSTCSPGCFAKRQRQLYHQKRQASSAGQNEQVQVAQQRPVSAAGSLSDPWPAAEPCAQARRD